MFINSCFPCFWGIHLIFSEGKIFPRLIYIYFRGFRSAFVLGEICEKRNFWYFEQLCPNTPEYKGRLLLNKRKLNTTEKNLFFFEKIKYIFMSIHLVGFLSTNLLIYLKQSVTINFRFIIITTLVSNEDVWGGSGVDRNFSSGFSIRTSFRGSFDTLYNDFLSLD